VEQHSADPVERAAWYAALGHARSRATADDVRALLDAIAHDDDARVRAVALGALVRAVKQADARDAWLTATADPDASVRRRAAELAPSLGRHASVTVLLRLLRDADASVAEAAAFALGERAHRSSRAIAALADVSATHDDPLVRESAVAALGALGDDRGRDAVLRACNDRPAIRRRAVLALAAFDGDDVDAALQRALQDNDWQVRQAAEDLLATE
jgi:HEAT repeat protein